MKKEQTTKWYQSGARKIRLLKQLTMISYLILWLGNLNQIKAADRNETVNAQQQKMVTGIVVDGDGMPTSGVTIYVKGTTGDALQGTITDIDGKFSIKAEEDAILIFSYIGMRTQEISVGAKTVISVTMQYDTEMLQDVVVVGYATIQSRNSWH